MSTERAPLQYLVEWQLGREAYRFATRAAHVQLAGEDGQGGWTGGLEVSNVSLEFDVLGEGGEPPGFTFEVTLPAATIKAIWQAGIRLTGTPCKLLGFNEASGRTLEIARGNVREGSVLLPGEPVRVRVSSGNRGRARLVPDPRMIVNNTTWPNHHEDSEGLYYPIILGTPGTYRQADGSLHKTAGAEARVVSWVEPPTKGNGAFKNVRVATTAGVNRSASGTSGVSYDGVQLRDGDLVLLRAQTNTEEDGIYRLVVGSPSQLVRISGLDSGTNFTNKTDWSVYVEEGDTYGGRRFRLDYPKGTASGSENPSDPIAPIEWDLDYRYGAQTLLVCGLPVGATQIRVFGDKRVTLDQTTVRSGSYLLNVTHGVDGEGRQVALIDLTTLDARSSTDMGPESFREQGTFHTAWGEAGAGVFRANGLGEVRNFADGTQWLLAWSGLPYESASRDTAVLATMPVGMQIDDPADPTKLIDRRLFKHLPGQLRREGDLLRAAVPILEGMAAHTLTVGVNCEIEGGMTERVLGGSQLSGISYAYALSYKSGEPRETMTWGDDDQDLDSVGYAVASSTAVEPFERTEALTIRDPDVWSQTTVRIIVDMLYKLRGQPTRQVGVALHDIHPEHAPRLLGERVRFVYDELGLDDHGFVRKVELRAPGVPPLAVLTLLPR